MINRLSPVVSSDASEVLSLHQESSTTFNQNY
jgi:hypothetical protein